MDKPSPEEIQEIIAWKQEQEAKLFNFVDFGNQKPRPDVSDYITPPDPKIRRCEACDAELDPIYFEVYSLPVLTFDTELCDDCQLGAVSLSAKG
jgi:hypothetical protein